MLLAVASITISPGRSLALCEGDCDGDNRVSVDELVRLVNIALGNLAPGSCQNLDDFLCPVAIEVQVCVVQIDDLIRFVRNALDGCPAEATATATTYLTWTPKPTRTCSPTRTDSPTGTRPPTPLTPFPTPTIPPVPPLLSSNPAGGAADVPRTAWIRLDFDGALHPSYLGIFELACGGAVWPFTVHPITGSSLVLNPVEDLPDKASCSVRWDGNVIDFTTAAPGTPVEVFYDRRDRSRVPPFPDDFWLDDDAATATGKRVNVPIPDSFEDVERIYSTLLEETNRLDGFSPIAHIVLDTSAAPDGSSVPRQPVDSLDPFASVGLYNITPGCNGAGTRVPFQLKIRTDRSVMGVTSHSILIFPSVPLVAGGTYGLVVTRRAFATPSQPFEPSPFTRLALAPPQPGEALEVTRARSLAADVLGEIARHAAVPIPPEDVALVLRISVRSTDSIPRDMMAVKEQVLAAPPPSATVTGVEPDPTGNPFVAAIVHGEWDDPDWRDGPNFKRDRNGLPVRTSSRRVPFTLALPAAALRGPVPVTIYQHGNPGSAEREVPSDARRYLGEAGFAVIGFTDILNRELSPGITDPTQAITAQVLYTFANLLQNKKVPDVWAETNAEQIAFVRMIGSLGGLDVLPIGAPDGVPELDVARPLTYVGISQGANHAPGLLAHAPEIRAAAVMVGGARLAEVLIHQQAQAFITQLGPLFPNLTPADIWTGLSLFQHIFDDQDAHNHGEFLYRNPLPVAGTLRKPSILLVEGLDDTLVPNHATESLAWQIGPIPHLLPVQRAVPFLQAVAGPLQGNIDADTTAGFFQYVPAGIVGLAPSPGCEGQTEGHYCAQSAPGSQRQRIVFFQSALEGVPRIVNPYDG